MLFELLINLVLIGLWSLFICVLCKKVNGKHFDERNRRYQPQPWENNGAWYSKTLKINKWKDLIPQYIAKGGFSKAHFGRSNLDVEYINQFILETCRAEWAHSLVALVAIPIILFNSPLLGITLSVIVLLFSFLIVSIQRYNRFRLQKIRKKLIKEKEKLSLRENSKVFIKVNSGD